MNDEEVQITRAYLKDWTMKMVSGKMKWKRI